MKKTEPLCETCRDTGYDPKEAGQSCPDRCWIARLKAREMDRTIERLDASIAETDRFLAERRAAKA
jgi:hypothetical protein